jgi:ABC-type phosphate/phosphonate transport system substrate-binding protein
VLKRPVAVLPVSRLPALRQAMEEGRVDLAWIRPANFTADAIGNRGYALVASAEGAFYSAFIVSKTSPLKTIKDLEGKQVMHPPKDAVITKMGAAELRDQRVQAALREQRLQEIIVFSVENGFVDAGIVNPRQAAKFKNAGGRVLHETRRFPYWALIASSRIKASDVAALEKLLLTMNDAPWGKDILTALEVRAFVAPSPKGYLELNEWIK